MKLELGLEKKEDKRSRIVFFQAALEGVMELPSLQAGGGVRAKGA